MTQVEAIENAIKRLSAPELEQLWDWLVQYDSDLWDKQIESDALSGKLDKFAEEALNDYKAGKAKEL